MKTNILSLVLILWPVLSPAEQVPSSTAEMQLSFAPLVKQAAPAVVNIYAKIMSAPRRTPLQRDPFFERFFRDPESNQPRVQNSLGSGVILSSGGIIVSNYHVVGMATDIRIVLSDRREFSARVLLGDAESDLAILQLEDGKDLPFLPLRDSDTVEVGELTLAIGNPFGVGQTVSSGIISGLARSGAAGGGGRGYFIQTDAPINPGNSGGALIDMQGRLVGVNTSILTRSGGSNGIGFAIPADLVAAFVAQANDGKTAFAKPWAGMSGQSLDADMALSMGLDRPGGIIVSGLHDVSPFAAADFQVGDVIVAVDDQPVNTPPEMIYRMSVTGLGETAQITRMRNGRIEDVAVRLLAAPDVPIRAALTLGDASAIAGLSVVRINPAVIAENNMSIDAQGVLITDPGPLGARIGLRIGDIALSVNGVDLTSTDDVARAFDGTTRSFEVLVSRDQQRVVLRFRV